MLLQLLNKNYFYIGTILFIIFSISSIGNTYFIWMHIVSFLSFILYGIVIFRSSLQLNSFFKKKNLAIIVFTISIIEVTLFQLLSFYIDGDTFVFSKRDGLFYYTVSMKMSDMPFVEGFHYMYNVLKIGFDDWGAFLWISTIFRIIPSQQFLCFCYCIVGTISALMLFDIGKNFMPRRYAFVAALSFSLASFSLVFQAVCLKESIMICCIIGAFNYFITYIRNKKSKYMFLTLLFTSLVFLFRIPTALLLLFSFGLTWVLIYMKGSTAIVLTIILTLAICFTPLFTFTYNRYLRGGDIESIMEHKNELAGSGGIVNQLTDPIAAFAGPFPSVKINAIKKTPLYAAGLLYRFLLSVPFFFGVYFIFKKRYIKMYPLVIFFLINAMGVAISVKGLETRLSMTHLAMMYIVSFWFLAKYDYEQFSWKIPQIVIQGYFIGIMMLCFLWNLR